MRRSNPYTRDDPSRKPHPGMLLELMDELGHFAADTVMIGDESLDREAARAAQVRFVHADAFLEAGVDLSRFATPRSIPERERRARSRA